MKVRTQAPIINKSNRAEQSFPKFSIFYSTDAQASQVGWTTSLRRLEQSQPQITQIFIIFLQVWVFVGKIFQSLLWNQSGGYHFDTIEMMIVTENHFSVCVYSQVASRSLAKSGFASGDRADCKNVIKFHSCFPSWKLLSCYISIIAHWCDTLGHDCQPIRKTFASFSGP